MKGCVMHRTQRIEKVGRQCRLSGPLQVEYIDSGSKRPTIDVDFRMERSIIIKGQGEHLHA